MLTLKPFTNVTSDTLTQVSLLETEIKALPHSCCRVGAPPALSQVLETEFDQACRMNREVAPGNAYVVKWRVCSADTLVSVVQSQLGTALSTLKQASFP